MEEYEQLEESADSYLIESEESLKHKYLTFNIGSEIYGISVRYIIEIVVMQEITFVPDMPNVIKGVINLRGNVISLLDMRTRFNLEVREYDDRTCIIVVEVQNLMIGLIVDMVKEVVDIPENKIDPPPRTHSGIQSNYIDGLGKTENEVTILLNVDKILFEEELEQIQ